MGESDATGIGWLKYRYQCLRTLELKRWDEFLAALAPDVTPSSCPEPPHRSWR